MGSAFLQSSREICTPGNIETVEKSPNNIVETPAVMIYNRVGKCGSRTVLSVIKSTYRSRENDSSFDVRLLGDSKTGNSTALGSQQQSEVVAKTTNGSFPVFYARHMNFLNFQKLGSSIVPVYINLVRFPVDRFISHFYFRRNGDNRVAGRRVSSDTHNLNYVGDCHVVLTGNSKIYFFVDPSRLCF